MKRIIRELEHITCRGYNHRDVFRDWLDLMIYGLQRDDENYLKIVGYYRNEGEMGKREIDFMKNAFHALLEVCRENQNDVLGELYMQWNISNKYTGQFFTPFHIAQFMSQITNPKKGLISDPTCGSGVMLVAAAKNMTKDDIKESIFIGQDLDLNCVKMCALNLCFFNVSGYVIWGNTLMAECDKVYQTTGSPFGGDIRELKGKEFEEFKNIMYPKIKDKQLSPL